MLQIQLLHQAEKDLYLHNQVWCKQHRIQDQLLFSEFQLEILPNKEILDDGYSIIIRVQQHNNTQFNKNQCYLPLDPILPYLETFLSMQNLLPFAESVVALHLTPHLL